MTRLHFLPLGEKIEELLRLAVAISLPPAGWIDLSSHLQTKNRNEPQWVIPVFGASDVTRTRDLLITSEMHYRLCYTSKDLAQSLYP